MTNLLGKSVMYVWTDDCQKSFDKLKAILKSAPVLLAPSFDKEFKLAVDANDVGAGSVLLQEELKMIMVLIILFVSFLKSLTNTREIILP